MLWILMTYPCRGLSYLSLSASSFKSSYQRRNMWINPSFPFLFLSLFFFSSFFLLTTANNSLGLLRHFQPRFQQIETYIPRGKRFHYFHFFVVWHSNSFTSFLEKFKKIFFLGKKGKKEQKLWYRKSCFLFQLFDPFHVLAGSFI